MELEKEESKPIVLVLMGPPGSGKGTHATPLSSQLSIPHISTGDLFRENIRNQTPLGIRAKGFIDIGNLVPDELVLDMLFERVEQSDCANGYILDGFPRTVPQAKAFDQRLNKNLRLIVLNFNLDDSIIIERITGRIACKCCGRPFHKLFDLPKISMVCDDCGGDLYQRDDDHLEVIKKRLDVYRSQTEPLIHFYEQKKNVLQHIDSRKEKRVVFEQVIEALPLTLLNKS